MKHSCVVKSAMSAALLGFLALGLAPVALANTATTNFTVNATVVTACIVSATNMAFGTVVPSTTTVANAQSTITLNCTLGDNYSIALSAGGGASETNRSMTGTAHGGKLLYALSSTAYGTLGSGGMNWGTTTSPVSGTGTGAAVPLTVYGVVSEQAPPVNDTYTDTINVTVTF